MDTSSSKTGTTRAEGAPTTPAATTEAAAAPAAAAADLPDGVGLHDLLSLGAIREALLLSSGRLPGTSAGDENNGQNEGGGKRLADEEARRLPLLLRLLSASRPLSSLPTIESAPTTCAEADNDGSAGSAAKSSSEADLVVPLLEQVAAYHPQAELIEIILGGGGGSSSTSHSSAASNATKFIGHVPTLTRKPVSTEHSGLKGNKMLSREWDTTYLKAALAGKLVGASGASSKSGSKKRRISDLMADGADDDDDGGDNTKSGRSDEIATSDDDDEDGDAVMTNATADQPLDHRAMLPDGKKAKTGNGTGDALAISSSFLASAHEAAAQDTTEATVSRTLKELTTLVLASIEPPMVVDLGHFMGGTKGANSAADGMDGVTSASSAIGEDEKEGGKTTNASDADGGEEEAAGDGDGDVGGESSKVKTAPVFIKLEPDSLFAEESFGDQATSSDDHGEEDEEGKSKSTGALHGYGAGSELKATIASLLQHTPALRYRHIANALCRSAAPQAAAIVASLASNCPQASPCLLAGCIDAANAALVCHDDIASSKVAQTAEESARALADLSTSEAWNVVSTLTQYRAMGDVALDLLLRLDSSAAVAAIQEDLLVLTEALEHVSDFLPRRSADTPKHSVGRSTKKRQRRRIRPSREIRTEIANAMRNKPWLVGGILSSNEHLARKTRKCILDAMEGCYNGDDVPSLGKAILAVRTHALLVHSIGIGSGSSFGSGSAFVQSSMEAIDIINGKFSGRGSDELRILSICACLLTCSKFAPIAEAKQTFINSPACSACSACLLGLLDDAGSVEGDTFAGRAVSCFLSQDGSELERLVTGRILGAEQTGCLSSGFFNTCRWASSKISSDDANGMTQNALRSIDGLNDSTRRGGISSKDLEKEVKALLDDPVKCRKAIEEDGIVALLENVVKSTLSEEDTTMPLILPLLVEALAKKGSWRRANVLDAESEGVRCQLVLQLLYSLLFLEESPNSPFVVDPRYFPLTDICNFCRENSFINDTVASRLNFLSSTYVPEVLSSNRPEEPAIDKMLSANVERKISISMVTNAIKSCNIKASSSEHALALGRRAELLYLRAKAEFPANDVDTAVACTLISSANLPPRAYTHTLLCKDPLLILKCHMSVWKCPGLRRIVLSILQHLLDANNFIALQDAPTEESGHQMLAARDAVVARCLLISGCNSFAMDDSETTSKKIGTATRCSNTIAFIRSLIANRPGVITTLVKQSLPNKAIDWLIEIAPECFGDAKLLIGSLSDRNSTLTAAERMVTADAALRIAIAHGSQDDAVANQLTYAALNTLVSSFFLSLGPVGVPVNILHEDDGRSDVTQTCRKATFRMLSAIQSMVESANQNRATAGDMHSEARRILSKMAAMCKSESALGGTSGTVAMRRKALLKELWDAIVRAGNALGGGLQA